MALERSGVDPFRAGNAGRYDVREGGAGFRTIIGEGARARDVTPGISGLRYSSRLPGGYADCSFVLTGANDFKMVTGDRVRVYFRGRLAWDGFIEELPTRGTTRSPSVVCLGHGAKLRGRKWSKLVIEHGYGRWRPSAELAAGNPPAEGGGGLSALTPGIPPGGNDVGLWIIQAPSESLDTANGKFALTYTAPPGTEILRVKGTHYQNHINLMTHGLYAYAASEGPPAFIGTGEEVVFAVAGNASSASYDDTLAEAAKYLQHVIVAFTSYGPAAADLRLGVYDHYVIGATDANGAVFDTDNVTSYRVLESLLQEFGGDVWMDRLTAPERHPYIGTDWDDGDELDTSLDPTYAWTDLVFESATLEDAIVRLNTPVGWEWGVFEDGRLYWAPLETIMGTSALPPGSGTPATAPVWWYQARESDGWDLALTESRVDVVNAVQVRYTTAQGIESIVELTDFANPSNPLNDPSNPLVPVERRDGVFEGGQMTDAEAAVVARAYLRQYGRSQVKGTVTVGAPVVSRGSSAQEREVEEWAWAPCIRPGEWVAATDASDRPGVSAVTTGNQLSRTGTDSRYQPPGALLPIRSVDVEADTGRVTLNVDTSRDTFQTMMARFARGVA